MTESEIEKVIIELNDKTLEEYLGWFVNNCKISLDELTKILTCNKFKESKPYYTRRKLVPRDNRFEYIEIVYDNERNVKAIVWEVGLTFNSLVKELGDSQMEYEPYSNTTVFIFNSLKNPFVHRAFTRCNGFIKKNQNNLFLNDESIEDINFSFFQISIN